VDAPANPQSKSFSSGSLLIGAGNGCDLVIENRTVSRHHVRLSIADSGVELVDVGSRNGTFLNGQRIGTALISSDAVLRLGTVSVRLELTGQNASTGGVAQFGRYAGKSAAVYRVVEQLKAASQSDIPLLLEGESGTGKELVANAIHENSPQRRRLFIATNCGALDRQLACSELFGHARGSFTGASQERVGLFEQAHEGTLLLDEVGELPLDVQPILLRALETGSITRLGDSRARAVRVRIIAATNRNLREEVRLGRFRQDLFFRLAALRIELPPLRSRKEDIEYLALGFMQEFGMLELPSELLETFKVYFWPGNVRELRNAIKGYSVVHALPPEILERRSSIRCDAPALDVTVPYHEHKKRLNDVFVRSYLELLLRQTSGNQSEAARISGLDRSHLNRLVAQFLR